jgi:hypothetical protein
MARPSDVVTQVRKLAGGSLFQGLRDEIAQLELPARPGYGQRSDSHRDSDIQARAVSKIVSNKADVHPAARSLQPNVGCTQ